MDGVLNETTNTVHKRETGATEVATVCGATYHVASENLHSTQVESAVETTTTKKCGRCFEDGGGY